MKRADIRPNTQSLCVYASRATPPQDKGRIDTRIHTKPMNEGELSRQVADYLDWTLPRGAVFTHIASGGGRDKATAGRLKAEGVRPGAPDLVIIAPGAPVIFIELKARSGRLRPEQITWADAIKSSAGGVHFVCRSLEEVDSALRFCGLILRRRAP